MVLNEETWSGMHIIDRRVPVPLDWDNPQAGTGLQVFFREVCKNRKREENLPLLVYLQGGPGKESPRPGSDGSVWLLEALQHFRVILPDQRGTGRSSRIAGATMEAFAQPEAGADYLAHFDAHAIVADLEHIRKTIYHGKRWSTLGQSYGGFLTLTYLSAAPQGVAKAYIAGGLPSLRPDADEVYRRTYPRVARKLAAHVRRFSGDGERLNRLADFIQTRQPTLPNGDPLTVRRLQMLGLMLGMGQGSQRLHWLLEMAFTDATQQHLNRAFLTAIMAETGLDGTPLFAALHENIYADPSGPCQWAAQRQRPAEFAPSHRPLHLTGEMIFPWMFDEISALRPFREAVHGLAARRPAKPYYDPATLAANTVPVAAVIYFDDMFVDYQLSVATAEAVANTTYWITNEYEHDGLRQDARVFGRLLELTADC